MPDSIILSDNVTARAPVAPTSVLAIVDQIIKAFASGEWPGDAEAIKTLKPIIGHFCIADAVLLIDGIDAATQWHICNLKDGGKADYASPVKQLLHEFICTGFASGPACASARCSYVFKKNSSAHWTDDHRRMLTFALAWDINSMRFGSGYYWVGSLFGGGLDDPRHEMGPENWWDLRERVLRGETWKGCLGFNRGE